ncbi:iron transporter [Leifsonia sp. Leaf336]|uniref:putative F420-0 ABC transporter substrate-binding protein n=1 Tax=Leifsonia sp. Leaf336 TaxID=1736341 RepID=UPI0006FAF845|nr:putative F420-0 ABC transporter substrate-binding protein [Leifsonia sp. Leaf336]KQR50869.1 iron transporter [Leifsonia sp. Leaf336]
MSAFQRRLSATALIAATLALTACAGPGAGASAERSAPSTVSIDNCGFPLVVAAAPKRVVTIKSTSTEMLLALGLQDRIVGTAFADGPVPRQWAKAAAGLPALSDGVPSEEALLALHPDFVYAGWESNVSAQGAGDRTSLQSLGVASYVSPAACKEPAFEPKRLRFADIYREIRQVGRIFDVDTSKLIAEQEREVASVRPLAEKVTALWYSSGTDAPYVGADTGAPALIMRTVGLTNVAADIKDTWATMSWEAVAASDPDVIVLIDASWNTAEQKIRALQDNPATSGLRAVRDQRFVVVPFAASQAGVRTAPETIELSDALAALGYAR